MNVLIERDSVNSLGIRITTFVMRYPRFIHSQMMTHRVFSRNASSSRAIPVEKIVATVEEEPVIPVEWGKNQRGMVADEVISGDLESKAVKVWLESAKSAIENAKKLSDLGVHKQIVNRILEPYSWINVVLTATEFNNFYNLRLNHDTQPEMQQLARMMYELHRDNEPKLLRGREWHLPFTEDGSDLGVSDLKRVSAARCARVSYRSHATNKTSRLSEDLKLAEKLYKDRHMSPFEHQAVSMEDCSFYYNLRGWASSRYWMDILERNAKKVREEIENEDI